jgi:hypothetical protein
VDNPGTYYGAYIVVEPSNQVLFEWPADAVVDFTLVPTGPLIDGSAGTALYYRRTVAALNTENAALGESKYLHDIPIGSYRLTARLTMPDGTVYQLGLATGFGSGPFQESVDVEFQPSTTPLSGGADPLTVQIYTGQ